MIQPRRNILAAVSAALLAGSPSVASAQSPAFPGKPITIVVPYQAGGSIDVLARKLAGTLSRTWAQPVIVDNRPGANGLIATQHVIKSPPDGHTILYHITGIIQNPLLYRSVNYDPLADVAPIIQIGGQAMALAVPGTSALTSVDQLVADGRSRGAKGHAYGSVGMGHTGHIWSELLAGERQFAASHAPYKGTGPLVIDLVAGRLDWAFLSTAEALTRTGDGSVRALAVTGPERVAQIPTVPTMRELGYPGFEMVGWHALFAAAGTPGPVIAKIEADVRSALADPEMRKLLDTQVIRMTGSGSEAFGKVMREDQARWAAHIKRFGIRAD